MADTTHFADDATLAHIAKLELENADLKAADEAHRKAQAAIYTTLGTGEPDRDKWPAQIADLKAKLAAAQRDAERYRWLRSGPISETGHVIADVLMRERDEEGIFSNEWYSFDHDDLDEAIDAAIREANEAA